MDYTSEFFVPLLEDDSCWKSIGVPGWSVRCLRFSPLETDDPKGTLERVERVEIIERVIWLIRLNSRSTPLQLSQLSPVSHLSN